MIGTGEAAAKSRNNFDFLRLLLAALVIAGHSVLMVENMNGTRSVWGEAAQRLADMAVNSFFALSGYLIVQSWLRDPALPAFLGRRVLRIYPGFIAASLVSSLLVAPLTTDAARYFERFEWRPFLSGMAALHVPWLPPVFGEGFVPKNSSLWTIAHEFRCYLLVAIAGVFGLVRRNFWTWSFLAVLAVLVAFPGLASLGFMDREQPLLGQPAGLLRFLCFFFAGGVFGMYRNRISFRPKWILMAVLLFAAGSSGVGGGYISTRTLVAATAGVYLLFAAAFWRLPWLDRLRGGPDISYGTYLYGIPVQILLIFWFPTISGAVMFIAALPLAMACGYVSWHLVEKPFLKLKPRPVPPPVTGTA